MGEMEAVAAYKTAHHAGNLTVADRWFASSQIHHGCHRPDGTPCRLVGKYRLDKQLVCPQTGALVDRDINAARNLRDWPDTPVEAQLELRPRTSAVPAVVPETAAQTIGSTGGLGSLRKTIPYGKAASGEARTGVATATKELRKGGAPE
jgi:putative transposase